ncbi:hypothetical protein [Paenibacillus sp. PK3_47]|uniref:hypothetical protein n=1 Tax=Paenibacillus sp. PK3_47 TaxID=2072642 RepID=UPI00201DDC19|nr:hypothetical protein [Paenibacillus sp. PK3_47]
MKLQFDICNDSLRASWGEKARILAFFVEKKQEYGKSCGILFIMIGLEGGYFHGFAE